MCEPCTDTLNGASILPVFRRKRDPARNEHGGQIFQSGERHHHGGQTLVARGNPNNARTRRKRTREPTKDNRGIVAIRQAIEHPSGALGAAIAWIGAIGGEGDRTEATQFDGCGFNKRANLPMARMVSERNGPAIRAAQTALRAKNKKLLSS